MPFPRHYGKCIYVVEVRKQYLGLGRGRRDTKCKISIFRLDRFLCSNTFSNYTCLNIGLSQNSSFCAFIYNELECSPFLFFLLHKTFTIKFSVGVVTRGKVKWLRVNLTTFSLSQ